MLVSVVIANGRLLADVPNTNFYTDAEALYAVQSSWKHIYSIMCEGSDDYFTVPVYFTSNSFTADASRAYTYSMVLDSTTVITNNDFYRLRLLQFQGMGGPQFFPAYRMNIENFGNTANSPAYRLVGKNNAPTLYIYDISSYPQWCLWYYPAPAVLTMITDLTYPLSMIPEIMAYQVAIEIRRKQNMDFVSKEQRKAELIEAMKQQLNRDEAKAENPKNVFSQGFAPYI